MRISPLAEDITMGDGFLVTVVKSSPRNSFMFHHKSLCVAKSDNIPSHILVFLLPLVDDKLPVSIPGARTVKKKSLTIGVCVVSVVLKFTCVCMPTPLR